MISEYPSDFFIYKVFPSTSFEELKGTCRTNDAKIWDIYANKLNQMLSTLTNTPYFTITLRQKGLIPEKLTNNQKYRTIVYKEIYISTKTTSYVIMTMKMKFASRLWIQE